jgi:glycosyltransferase involved in cell wall biosynthesis
VIASNHNDPRQDYASREKWDQNPIDRALRLRVLGWAAKIHVLLESYADFFPPEYASKIEVIHNYPPIDGRQIALDAPRENLVICVGRLTAVKNFKVAVQAWAYLVQEFPDWRLEIYGQGEEESLLRRELARLGLQNKVRLMGHTDDLESVYRRASILAHPSRYEGFPLSVTEALACGIPTVGFLDTSGVAQLVRSGENGLLADREEGAEGFAGSLRKLMSSPDTRERMGAQARRSVERFSYEHYRKRWNEVIMKVASR